jgi:hypothetical protein
MTTARTRILLPVIAITTLTVLLTGCAGGGTGPSAASTADGTSSSATPTSRPSTGTSTADPTTPTTPAPGGSTATSGGTGAATAPTPAGGAAAGGTAAGTRCATSQLSGSVADGGGGGGAGAQRVAIVLRNTGAQSCTLQGWPGISFVGGGDGTQIGNAATLDRATPHPTLTLRPSGEVQTIVTVRQAGDWDSATCHPRVTDGFRVIPPGSRQSLFVGASGPLFEACASTSVHQLSTSALASF